MLHGAYPGVSSLARLLAERDEITNQRVLAKATASRLVPEKVLSGMAESLCFDRVDGQACGHGT